MLLQHIGILHYIRYFYNNARSSWDPTLYNEKYVQRDNPDDI